MDPQVIELRNSASTISGPLFAAAGCLAGGIALLFFPDLLWRRWLAYPAAVGALIAGVVLLLITWLQSSERIVADSRGLAVTARGIEKERMAWSAVGAVRIIELRDRPKSGSSLDRLVSRDLVFEDRAGRELLKFEDPLSPADRYQIFLDAVPVWAGCPVQRETRDAFKSVPVPR